MEFVNTSLWDELAAETRPIFLYGTGNGGDKILAALEKYNVTLTGGFASDGFVRDRYFHDHHVRAYSDVIAEYGDDIVVLLAFGTTLASVKEFIFSLDRKHDLRIPDVPLYGGNLFDREYFENHRDILTETAGLFADDASRKLFYDAVNFRLTGKTEYLTDTGDAVQSLAELFGSQRIGTMLDGGAFKGDSAAEFIEGVHPEKILAVEADPKTFVKLSGSRGSGKNGQNHRADGKTVPMRTIDTIRAGQTIDLIKLDVEGAEDSALDGGRETLRRWAPNMAVSLYHRTDDLYALVQKIHGMLPGHRLYLRRVPCIPMWDLNLFAVR